MKNTIQQLTTISLLTLCLSTAASAQIKIGGPQQAPGRVPINPDLSAPLPAEGNNISGQIEIHKSHLNRTLTVTEVRRALTMSATIPDGPEQPPPPGGFAGYQPTKAVGRVLSLRVRETPDAFYAEYTIDRLPTSVRISFRATFDGALVKSCGGSSSIEPTMFSSVSGNNARWNGTRTFTDSPRIAPIAGSYNFALWVTCTK